MKNIRHTLLGLLLLLPAAGISANSLTTERTGSATASSLKQQAVKPLAVTAQSYQTDVWFHRVELAYSGDLNGNGYHHRLEVEIDADTSASYRQVFAEFSLLPSYGAERVFYTSSVFELFRQSSNDWLAIDTVLESRFAPDEYLLTIRLFDAYTGYLVAEISGFDNSQLDYIPLEDYSYDSYIEQPTVEVSGGSTGIYWLLALCLTLTLRRRILPSGAR